MEFTYILYMGEAIALTVMLGVIAIPLARKYKAQQSIREEGPKSHRLKAGTPTMQRRLEKTNKSSYGK